MAWLSKSTMGETEVSVALEINFIYFAFLMKNRNYLIGILVLLLFVGFVVTMMVYFYGVYSSRQVDYKDLLATFTAFIVSGSFIIATLNTKISANLNQDKLDFDRAKFKNDKKIIAYNLFKEYNSEAMTGHNERAVLFFKKADAIDPEALVTALNNSVEDSKAVTLLLNHLELVSICYIEDIADQDLLKELFVDIFRGHYGQFNKYILAKQAVSPNFFDTFTDVVAKWK